MAKVVLVDDEMTIVQMVGELLRAEGHQVVPFTQSHVAVESLATVAPELILIHLGLDKTRAVALSLLQKSRTLHPPALVMLITPASALEGALEAIRRGAYDYIVKPFTLDELRLRVQRALCYHAAVSENDSLRRQLGSKSHFRQIIGSSAQMRDILSLIERAAPTSSSVLICGESGTGKELIARTIHYHSRRRFAPFVPIRCSQIPESLLEIELFGQRRGPLNSAKDDQPGLLREADGGTLFLSDLSALSIALQTRLLRVMEDRQLRHPGDASPVPIDVRMLATSEQALEERIAQGTLLRDLYQRLNEISISVPPLRERAEDIPLLISHFLDGKIHVRSGQGYTISREAIDACCSYAWPGNVGELEAALDHARVVCQANIIQLSDLPRAVQQLRPVPEPSRAGAHEFAQTGWIPSAPAGLIASSAVSERSRPEMNQPLTELVPLKKYLRDQEISYLHRTLALVGGSKERAAEVLRISLATIYRKLSEPGSSDPL